MKIVRLHIKAPNDRRTNAAYNKVFRLFDSQYTSLEEYDVQEEESYVVDLPLSAVTMIDGINDIPFVTAEVIEFPEEVMAVMNSFDENTDSYAECRRCEDELKPLGWTFEWYLDGQPYYLRKMNREDLVQLWLDAEEENRKHTEEGNTKCLALKDAFSEIYSTLSIEEQKDVYEELDSYGA